MKLNDISTGDERAAKQAARYALLRTAQSALAVKGKDWDEQHRTCWCSRSLKRGNESVDVFRNAGRDGASFAGLHRCGNLHTCPLCAAKAGELRRKQLSAAMTAQIKRGGWAYLLTFTFPHCGDEQLADLLKKFDKARQRFQNRHEWKAMKKARHVIGVVNSLEFTVSQENGWHPHVHMLMFSDKQTFAEGAPVNPAGDLDSTMIQQLKKLWVEVLFKCGLGDNSKLTDMMTHALNVRGGEKAAEYIAKFGRDEKWGASSELARSHAKDGGAGERWGMQHFTPFQLLHWIAKGDAWSLHRFREYATAVEGKRALTWSPGLKAALDVCDVDEEEWAKSDQPEAEQVLVGQLDAEQFSILQSRKAIPAFLAYAATCAEGQGDLDEYIALIATMPKVVSGAIKVRRHFGGGRAVIYA